MSIFSRQAQDGSNLGGQLANLFEVLNTPKPERQNKLDEDLAAFEYINGLLFKEPLRFAAFNKVMREALLECAEFNWAKISPAVFGSLFQSVMAPRERRQLGAHYTSEKNIIKVVRSLFLDQLREELERIKTDKSTGRKSRLDTFLTKISELFFFDPACGCGNFLVITYRELRKLELDALVELFTLKVKGSSVAQLQKEFTLADVNKLSRIDVDQMYGIEIEEFPARIAEVALWLMDHLMNRELSAAFGQFYMRIPLRNSPHIAVGNALQLDWNTVLAAQDCDYILGNPPFVGKNKMTAEQNSDMNFVCGKLKGAGLLDYVTAWYFKAEAYVSNYPIRVSFVSTNSICQGEQVGVLWNELFRRGIQIHFAHSAFPWESEARGKAHVHVVIIGFGRGDSGRSRLIYDYEASLENPTVVQVRNISPYLVEGPNSALNKRTTPISTAPAMAFGSMPNDGGHLLLTDEEKRELVRFEPGAAKYIRPFLGSEELINGIDRWCLWLIGADPADLAKLPQVMDRIKKVKEAREKSKRPVTQELARTPTLFGEIRQPGRKYLAVPEVSSERRKYIPLAFLGADIIASNKLYTINGADGFHFGILHSLMHMAWMRRVTGRLESRYQYSGKIVYNNFPWPDVTNAEKEKVIHAANEVLTARAKHPAATLAQLYDPLLMPPELVKAHSHLDKVVDKCYRADAFHSERERVEFLFARISRLLEPLIPLGRRTR